MTQAVAGDAGGGLVAAIPFDGALADPAQRWGPRTWRGSRARATGALSTYLNFKIDSCLRLTDVR